jgi:hypothetical protein
LRRSGQKMTSRPARSDVIQARALHAKRELEMWRDGWLDGWKSQLLRVCLFISARAHIWPPISGWLRALAPFSFSDAKKCRKKERKIDGF